MTVMTGMRLFPSPLRTRVQAHARAQVNGDLKSVIAVIAVMAVALASVPSTSTPGTCGVVFRRFADDVEVTCVLPRGHASAHHWEPLPRAGWPRDRRLAVIAAESRDCALACEAGAAPLDLFTLETASWLNVEPAHRIGEADPS
jgi:hypothetical protein